MPGYLLSRLARRDLFRIVDYTVDTWGAEQARGYLDSLQDCLEQLATTPRMGRPCDRLRPGYRRFEHRMHVIFYKLDGKNIFISRILHQRMLPERRLMEEE